jgi:hypothetical protein
MKSLKRVLNCVRNGTEPEVWVSSRQGLRRGGSDFLMESGEKIYQTFIIGRWPGAVANGNIPLRSFARPTGLGSVCFAAASHGFAKFKTTQSYSGSKSLTVNCNSGGCLDPSAERPE